MGELLARTFSQGRFGLRHLKHGERGAALSAVAAVDRALKDLLLANLIKNEHSEKMLFAPNYPLSSVQAKAHLAFMMGLINKEIRGDLIALSNIRNRFAHYEETETFEDKKVCEELAKLKTSDAKYMLSKLPSEWRSNPELLAQAKEQLSGGFVFEHNISAILRILQDRLRQASQPSPMPSDASPDTPP